MNMNNWIAAAAMMMNPADDDDETLNRVITVSSCSTTRWLQRGFGFSS